jgi:hypothetical protein
MTDKNGMLEGMKFFLLIKDKWKDFKWLFGEKKGQVLFFARFYYLCNKLVAKSER